MTGQAISLITASALLLIGCVEPVRKVTFIGSPAVDDANLMPPRVQRGNAAIIELGRDTLLTYSTLARELAGIAKNGFTTVILTGTEIASDAFIMLDPADRPVSSNIGHTSPLLDEAIWRTFTATADSMGLAVIADFRNNRFNADHPMCLEQPDCFEPADHTGSTLCFAGDDDYPVRLHETERLDWLQRTGCSGVLITHPEAASAGFARSAIERGLLVVGRGSVPAGGRTVFIPDSWIENPDDLLSEHSLILWECGRKGENVSNQALRFMLPGMAAVHWRPDRPPSEAEYLASLNRLKYNTQALHSGRTGGARMALSTGREDCITAFQRHSGTTGIIFLLNHCEMDVDFKLLTDPGGLYRSTTDYRLLSDFSPNRLVLRAGQHCIFTGGAVSEVP